MIPEVLTQIARLAYHSDYIVFYYSNPFGQDILFQITWNKHEAQWFRYTLTKPTPPYKVQKEWGSIKPDAVLPIWQKIHSLALPAHFDCESMGRDGYAFRIEIGGSFSHLAYQWYEFAEPDSWKKLNAPAHELIAFSSSLVGKEQEMYEIRHEEEETDLGTTLFWEIKLC